MKTPQLALIASMLLLSLGAMAEEVETFNTVDQLKVGQCLYGGVIYEPGEFFYGDAPGVAHVCTNVNGKGVALTVTSTSMDQLNISSTVKYRIVYAFGTQIRLADTTFSKDGVVTVCKQHLRAADQDDVTLTTSFKIQQDCTQRSATRADETQ
ncbi:hypothetical protein [Pseudomonas sp. UMAB-40]|uniref:hypothetical protein n=1 Tax=Pseudomonas sp. UMAB-40 TaxID=1365407 RepID=UPI001C595D93|nr:hypothetical protein [Pseudomonas sp. UMAB-40]